jgi:hypothetical protein
MADQEWWETDEENDEVATKPELWRPLATAVGGFDLDPAAGAESTPIADDRYTEADDGLTLPWYGTVWLNPPFSEREQWYRRLVSQYECDEVDRAVAVITNDWSTEWYQRWVARADVIGKLEGRDWFTADGTSPSWATGVAVWNPTPEVVQVLRRLGIVERPEHESEHQRQLTDLVEFGGE